MGGDASLGAGNELEICTNGYCSGVRTMLGCLDGVSGRVSELLPKDKRLLFSGASFCSGSRITGTLVFDNRECCRAVGRATEEVRSAKLLWF